MHHMFTPEAREHLKYAGDISSFLKPIRTRLAASKSRKTECIALEINEELFPKLGFKLFEEDAFRAFAKRGVDSIKAIKTHNFLRTTAAQFGKVTPTDFIDDAGVRWMQSTAKELAGIRLPEPIVRHIDEFKKILKQMDKEK